MINYLWVALGSIVGGCSRFWISGLVADRMGTVFPWNTLLINISGSFLIGVFEAWTSVDGPLLGPQRATARNLLMVGVCGGYTTFSSFSLQTLNMIILDRQFFYAAANVIASVTLCLLAVWLGYCLGKLLVHK